MSAFNLAEIQTSVAKTDILKVNFIRSAYIFSAFDIISRHTGEHKGILHMGNITIYGMSTTADIYSHLDANATGEAGMKLGKLLSDDESEVS